MKKRLTLSIASVYYRLLTGCAVFWARRRIGKGWNISANGSDRFSFGCIARASCGNMKAQGTRGCAYASFTALKSLDDYA